MLVIKHSEDIKVLINKAALKDPKYSLYEAKALATLHMSSRHSISEARQN